ncbi:glycosyltransferase family 4 protein [Phascolarctobacterium sp.]
MRKKVLFLANHFITLYSFRKELIRKLVEDGHDVYLSIPESEQNEYFKQLGCKIIDTKIDRRGVNPLKDLALVLQYKNIMDKLKPDIIFSYTIKPNIYGTIASNGKYRQVCNITGTGATFLKKSLVSEICKFLYRISIKNCYKVFFQNKGDRDFFVQNKLVKKNYAMLPGSGCNLDEHLYVPMPDSKIIRFIFIGRVMKLKGIDEYLEAAKVIKAKYPNTEFLIAGWIEDEKYKTIIDKYVREKIVNYIGFRKNIGDWISKCNCTVLPSHGGEGVPNVLLESAATGRICIGSKINGTSDVIDDGVTGYLFETGNSCDLAEKIARVINLSKEERATMGLRARKKIEKEFNRQIVIDSYLNEINTNESR